MSGVRLSEKQRRFVEEYLSRAKGNGTQAARLSGYSGNDRTLTAIAGENLRKPCIIKAIEERVKSDPRIADRKRRQLWWSSIMAGELEDFDSKDRLRASELLGKTQGDFIQRVEVENSSDRERQEAEERFFELMSQIKARGEAGSDD